MTGGIDIEALRGLGAGDALGTPHRPRTAPHRERPGPRVAVPSIGDPALEQVPAVRETEATCIFKLDGFWQQVMKEARSAGPFVSVSLPCT